MRLSKPKGGFSIIELVVIVMIIGILSLLSIPTIKAARDQTLVTAFTNDLHQFSGAIQTYATALGAYPPDSPPGSADDQLKEYLPADFMNRRTPIGGLWDVDTAGAAGVTAAAGVGNLEKLDVELIVRIDFAVDDGNVVTGNFRLFPFGGGRPYWIIEE